MRDKSQSTQKTTCGRRLKGRGLKSPSPLRKDQGSRRDDWGWGGDNRRAILIRLRQRVVYSRDPKVFCSGGWPNQLAPPLCDEAKDRLNQAWQMRSCANCSN